ncbi:macrolide family glycosyltransferase [Streptomyces cinerochromogenes]|uniref:macrolide family glycosyltransferase n=1 Tax=Streptomyces cinerochromogenes TaxID=66422 RepID=UPI0033B1AE06
MSSHILFTSLPDRGHLFPHLAIAGELVARGHRVTFVTARSMESLVAASGATLLPYSSQYEAITDKLSTANDNHGSAMLNLGVDESAAMVRAAEETLGADRPDLIAYDYATAQSGRILKRKWDLPAIQLTPIFAQNDAFSYAQAFGEDGDYDENADPGLENWAEHPDMAEWVKKNEELLAAHGLDVPFMEFMALVQDPTIACVPRVLQPRQETFDERFSFVGPCISDRSHLGSWQPPAGDRPVVLVSLGTLFSDHLEFFKTCVEAFADSPFHVVLTLGNGTDPADLGPLPPHVEAHRWLSHPDVLRHARAFVTLGGMSSVNDALSLGCPMVVVPLSVLERVTAHQLARHGLSLTVDPDNVQAEAIRTAVQTVIADDTFRTGAEAMREQVREAGGAARAADVIESRLAARP